MRLVHWLVTLPLAAILAAFAVESWEDVTLGLWPLEAGGPGVPPLERLWGIPKKSAFPRP